MNLDVVATKLISLANQIEDDKGPLELFGLFLRDDSPDLWDVVIAAPWLKADELASFEYVASRLREALAEEELVGLSRIVILEHGGAVLTAFLEQFNSTGLADVHFVAEGGAIIRRVYILVARHAARMRRQKTKKPRRPRANSRGPFPPL